MNMLNECRQLWASRASQALDARLTNQVVAPSLDGPLGGTSKKRPPPDETNETLLESIMFTLP